MINTAKELYKRYEEIVKYLITGVIGTIISITSYWLIEKVAFNIANNKDTSILVANIISWVITVIIVYILNRKYVFGSKNEKVLKEFVSFTAARIFTLLLETAVIFVVVKVFAGSDLVGKILGQIVVIVTNYIFSKLFIFKK